MPTIDDLKKVRLAKLQSLKNAGLDPYPATVKRSHSVEDAKNFDGKHVSVVGRVMGMRGHGKIQFFDLQDATGSIQIVFRANDIDATLFNQLSNVDLGDFLAAQGTIGKTQAGEISLFCKEFQVITKALRPLPSEWHGLKDVEERYRQRYVDLIVNPGVRKVFQVRTKVIQFLRRYLDEHGFSEVETPVLQPIYGGASAMPFTTHHNALDVDMFLRISDELYLKRLIVGGYEKVYEIAKDFRNEGIDRQHNPEFTMLEFYWAYADYETLMDFTETMLSTLVKELTGSHRIVFEGTTLDFTPPWPRKTYRDVVYEACGIDIDIAKNEKSLLAEMERKHISLDLTGVVGFGALLDTLYKATARPSLIGPLFLTDRPTAFVTLAKRLVHDPDKTASFQLLLAGKEVINAYNELNDPIDQESRWRESEKLGEKGQEEHEALDYDYIRALEYGMPPTAGWGMGIDRLVSILTNQHTIKDVILFPTLKPEFSSQTKEISQKSPQISDQDSFVPTITKKEALELLHKHMENLNLRRHCYAVGYAMRALAKHLGGDPSLWEVLGILHDADWEETKDTPGEHTKKTIAYLAEKNIIQGSLIHALQSHNRKHTNLADIDGIMEWALETVDELTGFIVAVALVRPEKTLASVTVESILKKWKNKEFARAVDRSQIELCEPKLGITLGDFIQITLGAMQEHAQELGL